MTAGTKVRLARKAVGTIAGTGYRAGKLVGRRAEPQTRKGPIVAGVAAGAAGTYAVTKARQRSGRRAEDGGPPDRLNDPALARKVETEIFRDRDAPKGRVDVNAERGIVYLRGEVDSAHETAELIAAARRVDGVAGVESLLHLPGEEPKTKEGVPKAAAALD